MKNTLAIILLSIFLRPETSLAWGEKGHYITNEAAAMNTPNDLPPFFHQAYSELTWLAYDPDRWRGAGEAQDAMNPPDHFLDYEYVEELKLTPNRYQYLHLLETSGVLRRHGLLNSSPGFLPWRIAELSDRLTKEWRLWRAAKPGSPERIYIERDIVHTAGILGHFTGDAANPHHATLNFNGWVTPNPNHYATDCDTHWRFETQFVSRAITTADVAPRVAPAVVRSDYFAAALAMVRESSSLVERLYQLDRDRAFNYPPVSASGKEFAVRRLAAGAALTRDLWWSAWRNSALPPPKRTTPPED